MARRVTRSKTNNMLESDERIAKASTRTKTNGSVDTELARNAVKIAQIIVDELAKEHNIHLCKIVPAENSVTSKEQDSTANERRNSLRSSDQRMEQSNEHNSTAINSERRNRKSRSNEISISGESSKRITRAASEGRVMRGSERLVETPLTNRRSLRSLSKMVVETFQRTEYICSRCMNSGKQRPINVSNYIFHRCDYEKSNH